MRCRITFLALLFTHVLFSQIAGGGRETNRGSQKTELKLDNSFFYAEIKLTRALGYLGLEGNAQEAWDGLAGGMSSFGSGIRLGANLNIMNFNSRVGLGLNGHIGWDFVNPPDNLDPSEDAINFYSVGLGPSLSILSKDKSNLDFILKVEPTFLTQDFSNPTGLVDMYGSNIYASADGRQGLFRGSFGMNLRSNRFYSGFTYSFGKTEIELYDRFSDLHHYIVLETGRFDINLGVHF